MQDQKNVLIKPLSYHTKVKDYLKQRHKTWQWFKDEQVKTKQVETFKRELLKNTYRLDPDSHKSLYDISKQVRNTLGIDAKVVFYQENNSMQLNAAISVINNEAHIVFSGNILELLDERQLIALIAHELSHYLFYKIDNGDYEIAQRILLSLANDSRSEPSMIATARYFQLYLELFCDVGAFLCCREHYSVIQMLIKLNTGLHKVNAQSYLDQAKEILKHDATPANQQTHPETYLRSIALDLKSRNATDYNKQLKHLIEGQWDINSLDIFEQEQVRQLSHDFLQLVLRPLWIRTDTIMNLANQYFPDLNLLPDSDAMASLLVRLKNTTPSTKNYLCYLLLDFAMMDKSLEQLPLAYTLSIANDLKLSDDYDRIIRKELQLTVRSFKSLKSDAMAALNELHDENNKTSTT